MLLIHPRNREIIDPFHRPDVQCFLNMLEARTQCAFVAPVEASSRHDHTTLPTDFEHKPTDGDPSVTS